MNKIIHLDLDAFFCAVEEKRDPSLQGKPFAVGGRPESRGVVASCSYPARRFGVRSAMPMAKAIKLCPELLVVSGRHGDYRAASRQVMERLQALTQLVEQISIDEAFLDVTELDQSAAAIARCIQRQIRDELALPCSFGVASNKLVAKIASDVGKGAFTGNGPPNAITVVPPGQEAEFLAPLPSRALWGVGPKTAERLEALGMSTIGQIAAFSTQELIRQFGKHGVELSMRAKGIDERPIVTERVSKSISQETTFATDISDGAKLRRTLAEQAEAVSRQLRKSGLSGATVRLKLRWPDFSTPTRQTTLAQPTDDAKRIYAVALTLFENLWKPGQAVRLLGVGVSGLNELPRQLSLWDQPNEKEEQLLATVRELRQRFGSQVLVRGSDMAEKEP
ncbi:MAG: DNA polymerase IV [Caldilineaceae bacterium]|nr:DNA polymerase IV [Caldilineaceae bacterium]